MHGWIQSKIFPQGHPQVNHNFLCLQYLRVHSMEKTLVFFLWISAMKNIMHLVLYRWVFVEENVWVHSKNYVFYLVRWFAYNKKYLMNLCISFYLFPLVGNSLFCRLQVSIQALPRMNSMLWHLHHRLNWDSGPTIFLIQMDPRWELLPFQDLKLLQHVRTQWWLLRSTLRWEFLFQMSWKNLWMCLCWWTELKKDLQRGSFWLWMFLEREYGSRPLHRNQRFQMEVKFWGELILCRYLGCHVCKRKRLVLWRMTSYIRAHHNKALTHNKALA